VAFDSAVLRAGTAVKASPWPAGLPPASGAASGFCSGPPVSRRIWW